MNWLKDLGACWASPRHLLDPSFAQPVSLIREYFGSRVAFFFAWVGTCCKMLLMLMAIVVTLVLCLHLVPFCFDVTEDMMSNLVSLTWMMVLITWIRVASIVWKREQEFFVEMWDIRLLQLRQPGPHRVGEPQDPGLVL